MSETAPRRLDTFWRSTRFCMALTPPKLSVALCLMRKHLQKALQAPISNVAAHSHASCLYAWHLCMVCNIQQRSSSDDIHEPVGVHAQGKTTLAIAFGHHLWNSKEVGCACYADLRGMLKIDCILCTLKRHDQLCNCTKAVECIALSSP